MPHKVAGALSTIFWYVYPVIFFTCSREGQAGCKASQRPNAGIFGVSTQECSPLSSSGVSRWQVSHDSIMVAKKRRVSRRRSSWSESVHKPRSTRGRHGLRKPALSTEQIISWAQAHHLRTGKWPNEHSGPVYGVDGESWSAINAVLGIGRRGLPGGTTLRQLLTACGFEPLVRPPRLTAAQIVAWADAYHVVHGLWPHAMSGAVEGVPEETWRKIDSALRYGSRGLRRGSSLRKLLRAARGMRFSDRSQRLLTERQILEWADVFQKVHGFMPYLDSGPIDGAPGDTWEKIDTALRNGFRGLPGGSSLSRLLRAERGIDTHRRPLLTISGILAWADALHKACGVWPDYDSGPVAGAPGETWKHIDLALSEGTRGLPGGLSLAKLLAARRDVRNVYARLSEEEIVGWAQAHIQRTGKRPHSRSGAVVEAPGEKWKALDAALTKGSRGLPGGSSIAKLLGANGIERVSTPKQPYRPLSIDQIVAWATAYARAHGVWPSANSGRIPEAPRETWAGINTALRVGNRGLPGGNSLQSLFEEKRLPRQ